MRKWMTLILLLLVVGLHAQAKESALLFEKARSAYEKKDFDTAFLIYEGLVRENIQDPVLFFNFGNTLYQLNNKAKAIAYYEKALILQPSDQDIRTNLSLTRTELGLAEENPEGIIYSIKQLIILPYIALLFFWIGVFSIAAVLLFGRSKKKKLILAPCLIFLILGLWLGFLSWQNHRDQQPNTFAIALADAPLHAQAAQLSAEVYELATGQKVRILKTENNWAYIQLHNNRKAWVQKSELIFI